MQQALAVALLVLCVYGLQRLDWRRAMDTLRHANLPLVALGAGLSYVQAIFKSERWRMMLAPIRRFSSLRLYYYVVLAFGSSMLLPPGSGEVLRIYLLRRRHDVPVASSVAVLTVEKLFEAIGLMCIVAPLPFVLPLPRAVSLVIAGLVAAGLVVTGVALWLARRSYTHASAWAERWPLWVRVAPAIESVRRPPQFLRGVALSVAAMAIDAGVILLLLLAVGVPWASLHWATGPLVILAFAFAFVVPLTPGHVGTMEVAAVAALGLLGVPAPVALAFAIVYHALHVAPALVLVATGFELIAEARRDSQA